MKIVSLLSRIVCCSASRSLAQSGTALICFAAVLVAPWGADAAITVRNYYRMGENDPGAVPGVASTTRDGVDTKHLTTAGEPFYSTDVGSEAATRVSSSFSMNFFTTAYASGVLLTNVTDNFGLEAWVKPGTTNGNHTLIYNGSTDSSGWGIQQRGNIIQGLFGGVTWFGSGAVALNTWTHVAIVRSVGTATLYINGVASGTTTSAPNVPVGSFAIGVSPALLTSEKINGFADEVRFFTFASGQFSTNDLLLNTPTAPTVTTVTAFSGVFSTNENLYATANANGAETTVSFEYGLTASYGNVVVATNLPAGSDTVPLRAVLGGLTPGTLYHYRAVATNSIGVSVGVDKTFSTRNDNLQVRAHYRMGEIDGTNYSEATQGSESVLVMDSAANNHVPVVNPSTFGDPTITAQPIYTTNVATSATGDTGSSRGWDVRDGKAYGYRSVFYPGTDNFCLEAWVKPSSLSGFQWIMWNGSANNGWGLALQDGVYKGSMRTTAWASYIGEDFGAGTATLGEWTHLALVSNSGTPTLYVNGIASGSPARPLNLQGGMFSLGKGPNFIFHFGGVFDEVRLSTFPSGQFNVTNLLLKSIPPAVTLPTSASITTNSAVLGGTVTGQGGTPVTERGIVYSLVSANATPVIGGTGVTKVTAGSGTGVFSTAVSGLSSGTLYAFRPYAITTAGATYGPVASFATGFTPLIHYRMGEIDPGATVGEVTTNTLDSISTNHLTLGGTPTYSADVATNQPGFRSLNFSNGVGYGSRPLWPVLTDNFGFEVWVKPTTTSGTHMILYNGSPGGNGWGVLQNGGSYHVLFGGQVQFGSGVVTANQWTHLAMVRDSGVSTFYVNGSVAGTTTTAPAIPAGGFVLGADPANVANLRWEGNLDEVRLFAFPAGQFGVNNLLFTIPEIAVEQPIGTTLISGGSQDFGSVLTGTNASLMFTIRNLGNIDLTGLGISIDGTDAAQFSVTTNPAASLTAGSSTTFAVRFTPNSAGAKYAALHLTSNDADENPFNIPLTGTGIGSEISIEQPLGTAVADGGSKDFGSLKVGTNTTLTFNLLNSGNAELVLSGTPRVAILGAHPGDFSVTEQPVSPVPVKNSLSFTNAGFETPARTPGGWTYGLPGTGWTLGSSSGVARNGSPWFVKNAPEGVQAAFIQLNSAAATISRTFHFANTGNYVISFSAVRRSQSNPGNDIVVRMDGTTLGTVLSTSQPDDVWRTFTVPYVCTNTGDHTLAFVGANGVGDNASAIDNVQILHETTTTFEVTFHPATSGLRTATLSIANNDADENPYEIVLTGTGILPPPPVIDTESVVVLGNGTVQFTFINTNDVAFSVLASTNVSLPASEWTVLGAATNVGGGLYQFTGPNATNNSNHFYQLRFP